MATTYLPTARGLLALHLVGRFRCVNSDTITRIVPGSRNHFKRHLKRLTDEGYLERIVVHATNHFELRSRPRVYALGQKGARLLAEESGLPIDHLNWQLKNARAGNVFVNHALDIAATMVQFITAADKHDCKIIDHFDLKPQFPVRTDQRGKRNPFSLSVHLDGEDRALVPDRLFALERDNHHFNFALEVDRATMPVHRTFMDSGTHITQKIRLYWKAWQEKTHQAGWGFRQFRTLIVVPSQERITTIQRCVAAHNVISNLNTKFFLLTTTSRLSDEGPFAPIWQTITPGPAISPLESVPQPFSQVER